MNFLLFRYAENWNSRTALRHFLETELKLKRPQVTRAFYYHPRLKELNINKVS